MGMGCRRVRGSGFITVATVARGTPGPVGRLPSGMDSNLEAFSYIQAHESFAASSFPTAAISMLRIGGSSRTL